MQPQSYSFIIILLLVAFGIYRRVRRNVGWQLLNERRLKVRSIIFLVIGLIFLAEGAFHLVSLISDIIGIGLGAALAYYGAGLTRYEQRKGNWFFMPNTWIGIGVIVLFLGRLAYRLYIVFTMEKTIAASHGTTPPNMSTFSNSWTSGLLLIMFAYYVFYYTIVIRKHKDFPHSQNSAV